MFITEAQARTVTQKWTVETREVYGGIGEGFVFLLVVFRVLLAVNQR
ncbi:MAG: hypothetical protein AAF401_16170 [Pseudomonadota bacterium]